jgi:hypothetical protein
MFSSDFKIVPTVVSDASMLALRANFKTSQIPKSTLWDANP